MTSAELAPAYALDALSRTVGALLPEYTVGLPALALCVPVIGPALAPAALIGGVIADVVQLATAPVMVPRSAALAAFHGVRALLQKVG